MTVKPTGRGFDPHTRKLGKELGKEERKEEFIFPFLRSGVEERRGVLFCHSTRNESRIRQLGDRVS